mmetsp:Transcript_6959/g.15011  ORF Transcript_6959/g.15011 Transcript_6959/m.15011 type:complete len:370 (-) Transcript_6959:196-1305(-)|eukprot:CAMPEP_0171338844 /NCGR_PEP_ID=MMETSP0878-20121228/7575_1 /TAXON_ID=67004 /ORGANISM="Thalassiosira weissflogii, Strain CCMP1336" /LENGTH=369 /DNA_ID=CAMNT_0011840665 /DNA_START=132 /DNA_END=1241 /DNA_ORIENTATION=+
MAPRHPSLVDELAMKSSLSSTQPRSRSQYRARSVELTQEADGDRFATSSSSSSQLRQLETQLIDLKIELATAKTREDYLSLEVQQSHRLSDRMAAENLELRRQLGECLEREERYRMLWKEEQERHTQTPREKGRGGNTSVGDRGDEASVARSYAGSRRGSYETDRAVANRKEYECDAGHRNLKENNLRDPDAKVSRDIAVETPLKHPPSCVKLAYMNKSNAVSCLSLDSSIESAAVGTKEGGPPEPLNMDDYLDEYCVDYNDSHEQQQDYGDVEESECYYDSDLPTVHLKVKMPMANDDDNHNKSKKKSMSHSTSCASGIAFLTGNMTGSTSLLSIREEFSLDSDENSEGWYEKKDSNGDDDDDGGLFI